MNYDTVIRRRLAILTATLALMVAGATHVPAQGAPAIVTSPANGATNVDLSQPFQWTTVANVQAYYLYVGTTLGANNLVNTGETQQTSYLASTLPGNQTLYARMWTKVGGVWTYSDSTFTGAPVARVTYPINGALNANMSQAIQWTSVANVQSYYLYVGTTAGANDLINAGEIHDSQQTSYLAIGLPSGQTLYARMWAKVGNVWRYTDSTFTAASSAPVTATLTYPANGAVNANMTQPFQWTSVANVQAYYLYVGTTAGANDLVNTGSIQSTSYLAAGLPSGPTLYARVWAKVGNVWRYTDSTFTAASSAPVTATLTHPANGAVNANMAQPFQWTSVDNVQAYYLYVGTAAGANDLVNTGAIQGTSYEAVGLPSGQTLYARMWAKVGNVWRYTDSTFTAASSTPVTATVTYPANGAVNANLQLPIEWTAVANVQAYYLYVGTTAGANDLVNTGSIESTSYMAAGLPSGQTLYARIWAKVGNVWRSTDSSFTVAPLTAAFTYPVAGAVNANLLLPIEWTTVPYAQAYYLYVGTTAGANDLVNTGAIQGTSYLAANLPPGQTIHARVWTEVGDVWRPTDSTFTVSPLTATLTYPADGAVAIDQTQPATWTSVTDGELYYLQVGSAPGQSDLIDAGATPSLTVSMLAVGPPLPAGSTLFARLWTRVGGAWRYRDSTFTASPIAPQFVYPTDGALGVDADSPFQWMPPANAVAHELRVGTSPGANDLFDSGEIGTASSNVTGLPATGTLYARASSKVNGIWRHTDIAFTLESSIPTSTIVLPADGEPAFDTAQPFEWSPVALARGYRLMIGTTPGGHDLHDSGVISIPRRFVPNLPIGTLFGRIETKIGGQWSASDFTFSVTSNTVSTALQIQSALWATDVVRGMAPADNHPFSWTLLSQSEYIANCAHYSAALLQVLGELNIQLSSRRLDVALSPNGYDAHTLVEMLNPDTGTWLLLDPTFGLTVRRTSDNEFATAEDVSAATNALQWSDVSYEFLTAAGDSYAHNYYLDYPLLFVNVYHAGESPVSGQGGPVLLHMDAAGMPVSGAHQVYAIGCTGDQTTPLLVNGVEVVVDCGGVDGLSPVFGASVIAPTGQTPGSVTAYRPKRYVF